MYTVVVRPMVTYAATIWCPRVRLKTSEAELKLQRMVCLGITGAMRTAPMEVLLGLPHYTCGW
jgi:phage baseplate assembly protein W